MPRNVYGPDHEAFRETAREFVDRSLKPRAEDFIKDKAIDREIWIEAGQARPARARGARAVRRRRRRATTGSTRCWPRSCPGSVRRSRRASASTPTSCAPYLVRADHRGAEAALAARVLHRRARHRDRDDRARRRIGPGRAEDHRRAATATTGSSTGPRRSSPTATAPTWWWSPPGPARRRRPRGITLFARRDRHAGLRAAGASWTRSASTSPTPPSCSSTDVRVPATQRASGRSDKGFIHMMELAAAGADRRRDRQHRARRRRSSPRPSSTASERKAFGQPIGILPAQQVPARRAVHQDRGHPGLRRPVRPRPHQGRAHRRRRGEGQVVERARCRTRSSTPASSCYGGYGYMNEYRVARAWRDARVTKIWAGSNEIMKELIGRDLGL